MKRYDFFKMAWLTAVDPGFGHDMGVAAETAHRFTI